jgi:glycosyltransferase involved in cell wall biosynthesis
MSEPPPLFCTIVAKNYLARARVLARSLREHHPQSPFEVLVVDDPEGLFDPDRETFPVRVLEDLALPRPRELAFRYSLVELCTAVKPFFLRRLLNEGHEQVVYLDPDVQVLAPLTEALEAGRSSSVVLTPHLLAPTRATTPWERQVLLAGAYNLGFVALRDGKDTRRLLDWWAERCLTHCLEDPERGLYVDQRWMDLAPGFVARTHVLRHPGYNVGRWNLAERPLSGPAESPRAGGEPLVFVHWSGLDPSRPGRLARFNEDAAVKEEPLRTLMRRYARELRERGQAACARWPYSHARLSDGRAITPALRELFREQPKGRFPDPFDALAADGFVAWARRSQPGGALRAVFGLGSEARRRRWGRAADRLALRFPGVVGTGIARAAVLARRLVPPRAGDAGALMTRVLALYDARPDLRAAFPQAFVEAHDAPRFIATLTQAPDRNGLSEQESEALRALLATRPGERLVDLYRARTELVRAFPTALRAGGDPRFLAWLRHSGRLEYGITEDEVLWFARGRKQHVCLHLQGLYRRRPEWQRSHPGAFTRLGRAAFLSFVRAESPPFLARRLATLDTLCLPEDGHEPEGSDETDRGLVIRPALLVGRHQAQTGMGELVRATRRALAAVAHPIAPAEVGGHVAPQEAVPSISLPPIAILHLNAFEAPLVPSLFPVLLRERPLVGYCTWELGAAPAGWAQASGAFDEVWTLSAFSAAALAPSCSVPVVVFPPCLPPPEPRRRGRSDFGLAEDEFVVLFAFDLQSEMDRKNPLALALAFRRAFRSDDRARLVLKVTSARERPAEMRRLAEATADLPVTILESTLDRGALHDLMRACDVYASLHRSEGFGLSLAEAMSLGRPVVATHYSGNLDFMSPWNSFPVPWTRATVERDVGPYRRGQTWAEPDVEAASSQLRRVFADREGARAVAERGREDVERSLSPPAIGAALASRLRLLGSPPGGPTPPRT